MTTLTQLADLAQNLLSDAGAATWTQAVIEEWCNAAIKDYSQHFPRITSATITTTLNTNAYDLPADFLSIINVEYPTGEDPPEYLSRLDHRHPDFWINDCFYDIITHFDTGDVAEIWVSVDPPADETITYRYNATHEYGLASGETVTVPGHHENILTSFVVWKAALELLSAEQQSPTSNSSLLMGQLANNAARAKRAYFQAIAQALRSQEGESAVVTWKGLADLDQIY